MKNKLFARFLSAVIIIALSTSTITMAKTIYAPDGRTATVDDASIDKWTSVGWYTEPVMKVYSLSGKETVIYKKDFSSWQSVGWYEAPVMKIYSPSGKDTVIYKSELPSWKALGWYEDPVRKVYSPSGQEVVVLQKDFQAWIDAGWYEEPVMKVYSANGDDVIIYQKDLQSWKNVGWYEEPVVKLYSGEGKTVVVAKADSALWENVGWYTFDNYIQSIISVKGFEKALDALDNMYAEKAIEENLYKNKYTDVCNKYYQTAGVPLVVLDWKKSTDSQGIPEITIFFRNISSKAITSVSQMFTCFDEAGNVTTDLLEYNGNVAATMSGVSIDPGVKFTAVLTLYSNTKTHSITWPKILTLTYSDGTGWSRY